MSLKDIVKGKSNPKPKEELPVATPSVDIYESASEFLVVADVPGVSSKQVDVTYEDHELSIDAVGTHRRYRRAFVVPSTVDPGGIDASVGAGVLSVRIPKRPEHKPKRISVKAA